MSIKLSSWLSDTAPLTAKEKPAPAMMWGLMAIYVWFLPLGHSIGIRNLAFFLLIFITAWNVWQHKLNPHFPLAWPWLIYGGISVISITYAIDPDYSMGEVKKEVGYGILIFVIMASWIRNLPSLQRFVTLIITGNIFLIVALATNALVVEPFWHHTYSDYYRFLYYDAGSSFLFNGVGYFSTYLVTVLPLIAAYALLLPKSQRGLRNWLFLLVFLNIAALFSTLNRMGLLSLVAETLFAGIYLLLKAKDGASKITWIAMAVIFALTAPLAIKAMQTRSPVNDVRWQIWSVAVADIRETPFTGAGFGRISLPLRNPGYYKEHPLYEHAHNMVINKGIQLGAPGIISFLVLFGSTLLALWPRRRLCVDPRLWGYALAATTMSVGVFVKNMTDDFFVNHTAFLYWALVGAVLGCMAGHHNNQTNNP